ncbi:ATP-dependent DNA helicase DinG [Halorhodospira neutriphila]|uniref:ATP-dependent DNA helicase DinG n=1 Tax=Halorhodospira neutriphila TaxID=168379 RepID=A0ABS1E3M0_9GAMM|nr:ATP-dependent DNA helicase DinG [Halorhodospira neutriphila]MBK1726303.1 hypothetical protein [Halorhodospira neutriphila]
MPDSETTEEIAAAYRRLQASLPGFRERPAQKRMIWEVAKALDGGQPHHLLALEAPTGTGKGLSYLLGGLPVARARGLPLVVATATVALQEQLLHQDLPKLAEHAGLEARAAVAKGRARYACPRHLDELLGDPAPEAGGSGQQQLAPDVVGSAVWPRPPAAGELEALRAMRAELEAQAWSGDLDEWPEPLAPDVHARITSTAHSCLGARCGHFSRCPVYAARQRVRQAELVIANHDLLLADLQLGEPGEGVLLPPPGEALYVVDEAHRLAEKAVARFTASAPVQEGRAWLDEAQRRIGEAVAAAAGALEPGAGERAEALVDSGRACHEALGEVDTLCQHNYAPSQGEAVWRFRAGQAPEALRELAGRVAEPVERLREGLAALIEALQAALDGDPEARRALEPLLPRLGLLQERIEALAETWSRLRAQEAPEQPPVARWIERREGATGQGDHLVAAAPVSVAEALAERLWSRCQGAVLTSATLTALGSFEHLRQTLGLGTDPQAVAGQLPSPFDYGGSVLAVPAMRTDPRDSEAHLAEVIERLPALLEQGRAALVLFTSRARMARVAEALPEAWQQRLQCQGERSREAMLAAHRAAVDAGRPSVLFGLAAMAEGVDLPGAYCDHVVIERIPFGVPTEPVAATLSEWLADRQRSPFAELSLPQAALRLTQACGRLVRGEADRGRITILDRRIVRRAYGQRLLAALPPFRREIG